MDDGKSDVLAIAMAFNAIRERWKQGDRVIVKPAVYDEDGSGDYERILQNE